MEAEKGPDSLWLVSNLSRHAGEIAFINVTIRRLDREMQLLQLDRTRFVRRLNELGATTADLPHEVLATIFEHALDRDPTSIHGGLFPLARGAVCSLWRNVAWNTPSLWTCPTISRSHCHPDMIRLFFRNAKSLPLSVSWRDVCTSEAYAELQSVLHREPASLGALYYNANRLHMKDDWSRIYKILSAGLPNLRILELLEFESGYLREQRFGHEVSSSSLPSLKRLVWSGLQLPVSIPFEGLTTLHLTRVYSDLGLRALVQCHQLEEFHSIMPVTRDTLDSGVNHIFQCGDVVLHKLSSLTWTYDDEPYTEFLLKHVKLPSLKNFHFYCLGPAAPKERADIRSLRQNFFESLVQLVHLRFSPDEVWLIRAIENACDTSTFPWSHLPRTIEKLQIDLPDSKGSVLVTEAISQTFCNLRLTQSEDVEATVVFPRLKEFVIGQFNRRAQKWNPSIVLKGVYPSLLEMIESRRGGSLSKWNTYAQLERVCVDGPIDGWSVYSGAERDLDGLRVGLRQLIRGGLQVECIRTSGARALS